MGLNALSYSFSDLLCFSAFVAKICLSAYINVINICDEI